MNKLKIKRIPWARRLYRDNFLDLWFCPECEFCHRERIIVKKHFEREHQLITGEGVIL